MKTCSKCNQEKALDQFYVKDKKTGRLFSWCKDCHYAMTEERRRKQMETDPEGFRAKRRGFYHAKVEHYRQYKQEHRQQNLEHYHEQDKKYTEKYKDRKKLYRATHKEQRSVAWKEYCAKNPEKLKEKYLRDYAENKDRFVAHTQTKRAKAKGLNEKFTRQEWSDLKARFNFTCLCCRKQEPEIELSPDHVLPFAMGGGNTIANIQPLCHACNLRKGNKHIDFRP